MVITSTDVDSIAFKKAALKQKQSLPLEGKVILAQERIREWYEYWEGQVYVSFSGGKDSTVLKHIVDSVYTDIPAVFVNTGLEFPEIQAFVNEVKAGKYDCFNTDIEIIRPAMRFDEVLRSYGYPIISKDVAKAIYDANTQARRNGIDVRSTKQYKRRFDPDSEHAHKYPAFSLAKYDYLFDAPYPISHKCCDIMKKRPAKKYEKETGRHPILGTLACESVMRTTDWMQYGCNAFTKKRPVSNPLSFWTENDILQYLQQFKVPYCPVYGDIIETEKGLKTTGRERTGCIFCMFGVHIEKQPNRFQKLKETHPKQYEYCMKSTDEGGLGLGEVLDYIGVPKE